MYDVLESILLELWLDSNEFTQPPKWWGSTSKLEVIWLVGSFPCMMFADFVWTFIECFQPVPD